MTCRPAVRAGAKIEQGDVMDNNRDVSGERLRARRALAAFFIGAGVNHFVIPRVYKRIVPPGLGDPETLVRVSGVAEVAGGVGVLLLLAAVFPANVHMARNPEKFEKIPAWALYARLPLQPLMIWWVWRATKP